MQQYGDVKTKYPDAILLFRVGDFYETFGDDAVTTAQVLGIILTNRNNGGAQVPLAGFPYHSLDLYLPRLVRAGYRVAICEQLEKPSPQKKIVKRGVTEIVTPGVAMDDRLLNHKTNNFLTALHFGKKDQVGVAFLDISTGEFFVSEGSSSYIAKLVQGFNPSEILYSKRNSSEYESAIGDKFYTYPLDEWIFTEDYTKEKLLNHFGVASLKGFGIDDLNLAHIAAGTILHYLATTENNNIAHINAIHRLYAEKYIWLDQFTIRNLELIYSNNPSGIPLIDVLDQTTTPMGGRLLKKWVVLPLVSKKAIDARLEMVDYYLNDVGFKDEISETISQISDLERIISKVPMGKINPREIVQLKNTLKVLINLKSILTNSKSEHFSLMADAINPCVALIEIIQARLVDDPPVNLHKGGVIADGASEELDDLRRIVNNSKEILDEIVRSEAEKTGIDRLKIGFNNVFGYYLEVSNRYKGKGLIPENWVRKQTLTNAERYITEELKVLETKILTAQDKILELEVKYFEELVHDMDEFIKPIQHNASLIAKIDCLLSFALLAERNNYCKPVLTDDLGIDIKDGRHPVIEKNLPIGETYIPNDVFMDTEQTQIMMITGPNMSGKSALLRQTALICLMAQMGSFVPAKSAELGIIDKVFTRVGASDNISSGESTFMVEMNETASIMNNISDRSLILLDEIGRGTSTYDGISIAWAIAEYLHSNGKARPKTLFATHYHELNELANKFDRIQNASISTKEIGDKVIFLRKLIKGGSNHSFGIYVAQMAGMPKAIVDRAKHILSQLSQKTIDADIKSDGKNMSKKLSAMPAQPMQLSIFEVNNPEMDRIKEMLSSLDLNSMTPIECMMKLNELKDEMK